MTLKSILMLFEPLYRLNWLAQTTNLLNMLSLINPVGIAIFDDSEKRELATALLIIGVIASTIPTIGLRVLAAFTPILCLSAASAWRKTSTLTKVILLLLTILGTYWFFTHWFSPLFAYYYTIDLKAKSLV